MIDASIAVMLLIAIVTVALGGFWSGACERGRLNADGGGGESRADSGAVVWSPLKLLIFVALVCGMLFLKYVFYNVFVYVIIASFCLAFAKELFSCLDAVMEKIGCGTGRFSIQSYNFSVRSLILAAVCISIAVVWGVYWNEDRYFYVIIASFCLAFAKELFSCLDAVMEKIGCGTGRFSIQSYNFSVRSLILAAVCISIAVVWGVYWNEDSSNTTSTAAQDPTDQQNDGKLRRLEHTLLAAKWCQTKVFKGTVTLPEVTNMDKDNQLKALYQLKNQNMDQEEDEDSPRTLFVFEFEYQSDYDMFCEEFVDKGYKVDGSFKDCD